MKPSEITHPEMVSLLKKDGEVIRQALTGTECDLIHMSMGVASESGELLDAVKKFAIYRKPIDIQNVIEELGDLEFFMEGIRQNLSITREETLEANKEKLAIRYKNYVYTDKQAHNRADKQTQEAAETRPDGCCAQCGRAVSDHTEYESDACHFALYGPFIRNK